MSTVYRRTRDHHHYTVETVAIRAGALASPAAAAAAAAAPPAVPPYCLPCAGRLRLGPEDTVDWAYEFAQHEHFNPVLYQASCTTCPGCHANLYAECKSVLEGYRVALDDGALHCCMQCVGRVHDASCVEVPWREEASAHGYDSATTHALARRCELCARLLYNDCLHYIDLERRLAGGQLLRYDMAARRRPAKRPSTRRPRPTADTPHVHALQTPRARLKSKNRLSSACTESWTCYEHTCPVRSETAPDVAFDAHARLGNPYAVLCGDRRGP